MRFWFRTLIRFFYVYLMKMQSLILSLSAILVLAGCATDYHPMGYTVGYDETKLAPDCFRVVFVGNGYTSDERARDFALLRSTELVLQHGYTSFGIMGDLGRSSTNSLLMFYSPKQELMIRCFSSVPEDIQIYPATLLQESLKKKYDIE